MNKTAKEAAAKEAASFAVLITWKRFRIAVTGHFIYKISKYRREILQHA